MIGRNRTPAPERTPQAELRHLDSGLNILFLAALPMLLWFFQGSFTGIATGVAMIWILSVALRLIAKGQKIHRAYDAVPVARRPRLPRKIVGSVVLGLVVMVLAGHRFDALLLPLACGALGCVLSLIAFGVDPLRDKGTPAAVAVPDETESLQADAIDARLGAISDALEPLADADLLRRTEALRRTVARHLHATLGDERRFVRMLALADKVATLLAAEPARLIAAQGESDQSFARRRFVAKVETLAENFETRALKLAAPGRADAFDEEARRLMDRMPRESAA